MIDLTVAGCCLFAREDPFIVGQKVTLQPEGLGPLKGTIQWKKGPMAGIRFDNELYPAVFEHFTRTHPWKFSDPAKLALNDTVETPEPVRRELTRMIERAQKRFIESTEVKDVLTTRPRVTASRPGTTNQIASGKEANLFLG